MKNLIAIQDEYVETVNSGIARWAHRPKTAWGVGGGHANRIARGAHRNAERQLRQWGFSAAEIKQVIKDAHDMAALIRNAEED